MTDESPPRRRAGRILVAIAFAALGLNAWSEVLSSARARFDAPIALTLLQALMGASGVAAAWGAWRGARWAPVAASGYGVVTAVMLVALAPLLDLGAGAARGLWLGAALVLVFSLGCAWYLRRAPLAP